MDIGGTISPLWVRGVQKDHLVKYDFQRDVSCAEPSYERHIAHVSAPKVSHEVRSDIGTE